MPAGKLIMTSKRKLDDNTNRRAKRQRIRKRSRSEPLMNDSENAEKRQALKRLFGRVCSVEMENENQQRASEEENDYNYGSEGDENDDPLLDSVPVDMDPEQLGFLVCAQETLRFLHGRGIPVQHPVFARLRSRLLQGIANQSGPMWTYSTVDIVGNRLSRTDRIKIYLSECVVCFCIVFFILGVGLLLYLFFHLYNTVTTAGKLAGTLAES